MGDFGNKFRKARESKELSLDDVSNVTKISSRMLKAIEEERFDQLPGGVFNKGFIRAYAKQLGLDSEEAVTEYLACLRQEQIDSHAAWDAENRADPRAGASSKGKAAAPAKTATKAQTPVEVEEELPHLQLPRAEHIRPARKEYLIRTSSGIPWTMLGLVVVIVILAAILWIRHSRRGQNVVASPTPPPVTASAAPPPAATPAPVESAPQQPAANASATPPRPVTQNPAPAQATPTVQAPAAVAATPSIAEVNPVKVEKKGDVTVRSFGESTAKQAEKTAANLTLVIRASENSWISVTADGQLLTQETLIAPAATSFHASRELVVRVGNAAGVSFLWNGEDIAPQGAEAEPKTLIFDAQGMHPAIPLQNPP